MRLEFSHSIKISFNYGLDSLEPLHQLGDHLSYLLDQNGEGYYDGHDLSVDKSEGSIFFYANNAEHIYKLIEPILFELDWMNGATVHLIFGHEDPYVKSIEFTLQRT